MRLFFIVISIGLMLLLTGCFRHAPSAWLALTVDNYLHQQASCSGGLRATLKVNSISLDSAKIPDGERHDQGVAPLPLEILQEGVGMPLTVEAWCYDADNSKATGYIKIERPWRDNSVNHVRVSPHNSDSDACIAGVQERAPVPCVFGSFFAYRDEIRE